MINFRQKYLKKAQKWANICGKMPGVEAVFLSGSLAQNSGNEQSDIDFFIISKRERIWTARFFVFFFLKISGNLSKKNKHAGQICPNHFISKNALQIAEQDKYAANLFSHNIPLYDPRNIFADFVKANKKWCEKFGYKFSQENLISQEKNKNDSHFDIFKGAINFPGKILEFSLKHLQLVIFRIKNEPKDRNHRVIFCSSELRFHPFPKNKKWEMKNGK